MDRAGTFALAAAICWLVLVFELIRRRRLSEGYSLLWLIAGVVLVGLAVWRSLLDDLAKILGIFYPPAALFVIAIGFMFLLLLQQSSLICDLHRRNAELAQRIALLSREIEFLAQNLQDHSQPEHEGVEDASREGESSG